MKVICAEGSLDQAQMQERADYEAKVALAKSLKLSASVVGWRQPDGRLWACNELVTVQCDAMGLNDEMLIDKLTYAITNSGGRVTNFELSPPDAYTSDPVEIRVHHRKGKKGKKGAAINWTGVRQ